MNLRTLFMCQLAILLLSAPMLNAQDIRIYHGTSGASSVFLSGDDEKVFRWGSPKTLIIPRGKTAEIVIINPNPLLYTYEFKLEEFAFEERMPDITNLLAFINAIPDLTAPSEKAAFRPSAAPATGPYANYMTILEQLESDILSAKAAIEFSDRPESKKDALEGNTTYGYNHALTTIKTIPTTYGRFNNPNLKEDLQELLKQAKDGGGFAVFGGDAEADILLEKAFVLLNKQMVETVNLIKKAIESPAIIRIIVPVKGKSVRVRLLVKKKEGYTGLLRMEFDEDICILNPSAPDLELVPVINLSYARNVPEFSVRSGVVQQGVSDGFKFRAGAMLLYNPIKFGKEVSGSLGFGIGYNIPSKGVLESFYAGALLSFNQIYRIGIGIGFSEYPYALKDNAQVGSPLPANISNIEDIVSYRRQVSGFITFSISGITLLK